MLDGSDLIHVFLKIYSPDSHIARDLSFCIAHFYSQHLIIHIFLIYQFIYGMLSSVQFSHSVVSDSLRAHESQHARPPCPSPTPGVYSNSCPSSRWCHPAISSSVVPFFSCPQSLPALGSFPMSQFFAWGGQSIRVSASSTKTLLKFPW